jgi:hypothetical protein
VDPVSTLESSRLPQWPVLRGRATFPKWRNTYAPCLLGYRVPDSWRLKLVRAEEHFGYFKLRVAALSPQMYPVSQGFETYKGTQQWVWRLDIQMTDDPSLSVLVGDVP